MSREGEQRHPGRVGRAPSGHPAPGNRRRSSPPSTHAAGGIPHSTRVGEQQETTGNPRSSPIRRIRSIPSRSPFAGSQIPGVSRVARTLFRYGCAMLTVHRRVKPERDAEMASKRATSARWLSPGRIGSNRHSTRSGPSRRDSARNARRPSAMAGTDGSSSPGNPVRVKWKIEGYPAASRRERTGRNGTGFLVQKTKAATSSRARETTAGFPEYGARNAARAAANHAAWKAGMSVRRDALTISAMSDRIHHPYSRKFILDRGVAGCYRDRCCKFWAFASPGLTAYSSQEVQGSGTRNGEVVQRREGLWVHRSGG